MEVKEQLTADQTSAWAELLKFVKAGDDGPVEASLLGFAGTGKTHMTRRLTSHLAGTGMEVACVAPTNKAVQVLRRSGVGADGVRLCTLHSFLGLKPKMDLLTGRETFVPDPRTPPGTADLLVVDEASMVGRSLYALTHEARRPGTKVLWVGDPAQLPPVNEDASLALSCSIQPMLREVVRYGNSIGKFVTRVREVIDVGRTDVPEAVGDNDGEEGVFVFSKKDWMVRLLADFNSLDYAKSSDFVRALAWRNNLVNWGNRVVHEHLYGAGAQPFVEGQTLVAKTPVFQNDDTSTIVMATSAECVVQTAEPSTHLGFECWHLTLLPTASCWETLEVFAADPAREGGLLMKLEELKQEALKAPSDELRRARWRRYYRQREAFADLAPAYWSTVHKAQGSTFERAYVAAGDLADNPNREERSRMLYTSYTRPSKQLVISD